MEEILSKINAIKISFFDRETVMWDDISKSNHIFENIKLKRKYWEISRFDFVFYKKNAQWMLSNLRITYKYGYVKSYDLLEEIDIMDLLTKIMTNNGTNIVSVKENNGGWILLRNIVFDVLNKKVRDQTNLISHLI